MVKTSDIMVSVLVRDERLVSGYYTGRRGSREGKLKIRNGAGRLLDVRERECGGRLGGHVSRCVTSGAGCVECLEVGVPTRKA